MNFRLISSQARRQLVASPSHRDPETGELSDAMQFALAGDLKRLEEIEVEYLNGLVRIGEFGVRYPDGEPHEIFGPGRSRANTSRHPFVVTILRGGAPDGRSLMVWSLLKPCRRCAGKLRHVRCHVCNGTWYVDDNVEWMVYTDLDGVLVREDV